MSRQWTPNQSLAINLSGGSIIVSAAAGSGKTAVLVERVISMITDKNNPVDVDKILVVTYTRLAAQELKDRLNKKLSELIKLNPADEHLNRQKTLLSKAMICTVDSFCSSVVKEFFYVLDIERNFRILESGELDLIKKDALKLTLDQCYVDADKEFYDLVESFGGTKDDWALQNTILKIHEFLRSHPFVQRWVDEKLSMFTDFDKVSDSSWGQVVLQYTKEAFEYLIGIINNSIEMTVVDNALYDSFISTLTDDLDFLKSCLNLINSNTDWDSLYDFISSHTPMPLQVPKGYYRHPMKKSVIANRKIVNDTVSKLTSHFAYTEQLCLQDIKNLEKISKQLYSCVLKFSDNFQNLKAAKKSADYQDLEHWTIKLLVNDDKSLTDIAYDLQKRFDYILVDEYQDANEVQDTIFSALSRNESNLFFVGDVKQSIYGFRQAMPQLFLNRRDNATLYSENSSSFPAKIILDKNFRSKLEVTKFVNYVFEKLMSVAVGDITYDESEKLVCGAQYENNSDPDVTFKLLDLKSIGEEDADVAEATYIAQTILKMVGEGYKVKEGNTYRNVRFDDFAVLLRMANAHANKYVDTMILNGVPASCDTAYSFLKSQEIMVMTNLLSVIDNPLLDVELLSVMMSPLFGFTADEVALIRCDNRYAPLYNCIRDCANTGDAKCTHFLEQLKILRDLSATMPVSELLNAIYDKTGYMAIMSAVTDSDMSQGNLKLLKDYAKKFEQSGNKGLSRFVSYLNRLKENNGDLEGAVDLNNSFNNAVRVMSVHSSKGLEFPVCIVANMAGRFVSDITNSVLIHSDFGIAVKRRDISKNQLSKTITKDALALEIKRDEMSEELRVLYVAMTRAKQKLMMVSSVSNAQKYITRIASKIQGSTDICPFVVRGATSPSDWLTMCALLHNDGKPIRDYASVEQFVSPYDCSFNCEVVTHYVSDELSINTNDNDSSNQSISAYDNSMVELLNQRINTTYVNEPIRNLVSKVSASELAHKQSQINYERTLSRPAFMSSSGLTPAQRGTALHAFMQFCDFKSARLDINAEINRLVDSGYLSKIQAQSIDTKLASDFINSELITRVLSSFKVYKEFRFTVEVPAYVVDDTIPDSHKDRKVILQGAVDLAFVEDDELVIVDYKTDNVKFESELVDRYSTQLQLYSDAMEQCTGYKVSCCLIYSVRLSKTIKVK